MEAGTHCIMHPCQFTPTRDWSHLRHPCWPPPHFSPSSSSPLVQTLSHLIVSLTATCWSLDPALIPDVYLYLVIISPRVRSLLYRRHSNVPRDEGIVKGPLKYRQAWLCKFTLNCFYWPLFKYKIKWGSRILIDDSGINFNLIISADRGNSSRYSFWMEISLNKNTLIL